MGTVAAVSSLILGGVSTIQQQNQQKKAQRAQEASREEQRKAQAEAKASEAERAARERRQQVREERIKRAQIIQASFNSGVSGSSGELGGASNLASQLSSNLGFNSSQIRHGENISVFNNNSSIFDQQAANAISRANTFGAIAGLSSSIFNASGGFNQLFPSVQAPAPVSSLPITPVGK